jgi:CRP/FNR family cyclic AMP-dependent transcriptional regulator
MALGRNAKVDLIRGVPLFAHCSRAEIAEVAKIADEIDIPADKELTREGDRGREFFVLLEGTASVRRGGRR